MCLGKFFLVIFQFIEQFQLVQQFLIFILEFFQ
jgi:hypothetical protein